MTIRHQALAFIGRLYDIEREAKQLSVERRLKLRRARSQRLLDELHAWLVATEPAVLPKSPLGQAIGYVLPRWAGFTRYCGDGRLAIDNNVSERTLRPCTIGRKNWLFVGSERGGRTAAILFSLVASAKRHELEPFPYLRDVLSRINQCPAERLGELLPDTWLQQHPSAQRRPPR